MGEPWNWNLMLWHLTQMGLYGVIGMILFGLAYLIIDRLTPFSMRKEIEEDQNTALAILLGSVFIGIAIILAASIHG